MYTHTNSLMQVVLYISLTPYALVSISHIAIIESSITREEPDVLVSPYILICFDAHISFHTNSQLQVVLHISLAP